jgi:two-component system invasion response regulator UvrY
MDINVALVDDHVLLRNGLAGLMEKLGYNVLFECSNGKELIEMLNPRALPDIVLMDLNMPVMDGFEATSWLRLNYPLINVLALSMYDDEIPIIRIIRNGAKGYILKDTTPTEFNAALTAIQTRGFYYSELVTGKLVHSINGISDAATLSRQLLLKLTAKEIEFLKLVCTEKTYKEIADDMRVSPRTIDGYRDQLFEKLDVKSRVGLVLFAIKNGIVRIDWSDNI